MVTNPTSRRGLTFNHYFGGITYMKKKKKKKHYKRQHAIVVSVIDLFISYYSLFI